MENTFIVNIIHRPEMVPEYAEKVTGHGQAEDIGRKALLTESLDIFKFQQETAHKNGLKTTIQMTYASLFNEEAVSLAKEHHEKYGDEIALSLLGLPCTELERSTRPRTSVSGCSQWRTRRISLMMYLESSMIYLASTLNQLVHTTWTQSSQTTLGRSTHQLSVQLQHAGRRA